MTNNFQYGILNLLVRSADFLCQNAPLVCEVEQIALPTNRRIRGFLLGGEMGKHYKYRVIDREYDFGGNWLKALEKDNWTCQKCGKDLKIYRPLVHHKDETGIFNVKKKTKVNNKLDNLISLCVGCHTKLHLAIPIKQLSLDGKLIKIWESHEEAVRKLEISGKKIRACLNKNNNRKSAGGYKWQLI